MKNHELLSFSKELNSALKLVDDEIIKQFPTYNITIDYIIYAILCSNKSIGYQTLDNLTFRSNIEMMQTMLSVSINGKCLTNNCHIISPKKKVVYDDETLEIFNKADEERKSLKDNEITSEHILLTFLKLENEIKKTFNNIGITYDIFKSRMDSNRNEKSNIIDEQPQEQPKPILITQPPGGVNLMTMVPQLPKRGKNGSIDRHTINLNILYQQNKLDKVIGRDKEVNTIMKTLLKRNKNNVILTGEDGCGITSVVNLLVEKLVIGECPISMVNKEVLKVNINSMIESTQYKGIFEQRYVDLIKEVKEHKDKYILFLDDIHIDLMKDNNNDVLTFVNTLLTDDEIKLIATIPLQSYKKNIERHGFLEKRFSKVIVDNMDVSNAVKVLLENKHYYEDFHDVFFSDELIEKIVKLCDRYIPNKALPSSAIEIIDILGSNSRLNNNNIGEIVRIKDEINVTQNKIDIAIQMEQYEEADTLKLNLNRLNSKLKNLKEEKSNKKEINEITENDLLSVISELSKIPLTTLSTNELKSISKLSDNIKENVIGQDDAILKIVKTIQKNRLNLKSNIKKPSVFFFLGNSGVGKTLLAKQLAINVYGDEKNMLRIDCSELSEGHSISKLLGAPSGYIGYGNSTVLDKVKHNPYTVVLIDEIEKAHDNIYNLFLQLFDDGRITDSTGITIDFSNTIIIMTSNVGTKISNEYKPVGFTHDTDALSKTREDIIKKQLKNKFSPEFLNRINSIIYFKPLSEKNIIDIIELNLNKFNSVLNNKNEKYSIQWDDEVIEFIFSKISEDDKKLGARPVLRLIETYVEEKLTELLIENSYPDNHIFSISVLNKEINII
jgi:ATP-dependent Clp protease ATP-binding subunit ClpC